MAREGLRSAVLVAATLTLAAPASAVAASGGTAPGTATGASNPTAKAKISRDGRTAIPPDSAPPQVKKAIYAANEITRKPYRYGGGHGKGNDSGYDRSGPGSFPPPRRGPPRQP